MPISHVTSEERHTDEPERSPAFVIAPGMYRPAQNETAPIVTADAAVVGSSDRYGTRPAEQDVRAEQPDQHDAREHDRFTEEVPGVVDEPLRSGSRKSRTRRFRATHTSPRTAPRTPLRGRCHAASIHPCEQAREAEDGVDENDDPEERRARPHLRRRGEQLAHQRRALALEAEALDQSFGEATAPGSGRAMTRRSPAGRSR